MGKICFLNENHYYFYQSMSVEIVDSSQSMEDVKEDIKQDVEKGSVNTFSLVPTSEEDVHDLTDRKLKDITWTNVNFRVKNKVILNECWGEVNFQLPFREFEAELSHH